MTQSASMLGPRLWVALIGSLILAGSATAGEASGDMTDDPGRASAIADEMIVGFKSDSAAYSVTTAAMTAPDPTNAAGVHEIVERLSEGIGVPLTIRRVTSGAELLVAIDTRQWIEQSVRAWLANRLADVVGIREATMVPTENSRFETGANQMFYPIAMSEAATPLAAKQLFEEGGMSGPVPLDDVFAERGVQGKMGSVPLAFNSIHVVDVRKSTGTIGVTYHLLLRFDLDGTALLATMIDRLQSQPEVAYAQPNFILRALE